LYCIRAIFEDKLPDRPLARNPEDLTLIYYLLKKVGINIWDEFLTRCAVMVVDNYNLIKDEPNPKSRRILILFDNGYIIDILQTLTTYGSQNEVCINHVHQQT